MTSTAHTLSSRLRNDRGQTLVEFAVVLPILVLLLFGIVQFGLALTNYLAITDAARVGARAAAVNPTAPCAAAASAIKSTVSPSQWAKISSQPFCPAGAGSVGDDFTVKITYPYTIGLPGLSASGNLTASATEPLE